MWGIPGYSFNKLSVKEEKKKYPQNVSRYKNVIRKFNLFYIQSGYDKGYMNDVTKMVGSAEFSWIFENEYLGKGKNPSYRMMRSIESDINNKKFSNTIKKSIEVALDGIDESSSDYIWAPFDEVASGLQYWCWPSKMTDIVYSEIKKKNPNKLVYIDLLGSDGGLGNSFLFEDYYKKKYGRLPIEPPFKKIYKKNITDNTLLNFHFNYEGNSVFEYKNGKRTNIFIKESMLSEYWYQNVKKTAFGYRNSGDIFGVNSYSIMYENPEIAGITIDTIKDGIGKDTPVWIFFDSNGYAKPGNISDQNYVKNLKCQIYTSIVHEASGVLFWSDLNKNPIVFNLLLDVVDELIINEKIIKFKTLEQKVIDDIHYLIKINPNGDKYLIAVNTNTSKNVLFMNNYTKKSLFQPLEVYVSKF